MNKDQHNDIDKLFHDAFGSYEASPPPNMWDKIESNLPLTETDLLFKNAFENYERQPSPAVWERIEPELPLSLTIRNVFIHLSKIAAVLLIGITLYVFTQQYDWSNNENIAQQEIIVTDDANNQQEAQEVVEISVDELLDNEQIAMAEVNNASVISTPAVIHSPKINPNSPLNNPDNTAKGGEIITKDYPEEVTINVGAIARRVKNGNSERIPSAELYNLVFMEEEQNTKMDTLTKAQKEDMEKEMKELKNKKMEDAIADNGIIDFDGKIRRPKAITDEVMASTAEQPYLSFQGSSDESMKRSGMRFNRKRGFTSKIVKFFKFEK